MNNQSEFITDLDIAGFKIRLSAPASPPIPAWYAPFISATPHTAPEITLNILPSLPPSSPSTHPIAAGSNDLGEARLFLDGSTYAVGLSPRPGAPCRYMYLDPTFSVGNLFIGSGITSPASDPYAPYTVDSMLRILFAQAIALREAFLLHASAIVSDGKAYLFMGKSGTGKSTHASIWEASFPATERLNDDNPAVRILPDGSIKAYGTPWSGKTPCYRNASAPLAALTRLRQAPVNLYTPLDDFHAFLAILPGVSVITHSRRLYDAVCTTISRVVASIPTGIMDCLPDPDAARIHRQATASSSGQS